MTSHIFIKLTKIKHKEQMLKAARKKQQIANKMITLRLTADLSTDILQARRKWQDILIMKGKKPTTKINLSSKDLTQIQRRNQKLYRKAKIKRIQHHQTSFTTKTKGTSQKGNTIETKGIKNKHKTINYIATGSYISIITLNVNGLNAPPKRHRLAKWLIS